MTGDDVLDIWIRFALHSSVVGVEPAPHVWEQIKKQLGQAQTWPHSGLVLRPGSGWWSCDSLYSRRWQRDFVDALIHFSLVQHLS
jgi:hypothetical protein